MAIIQEQYSHYKPVDLNFSKQIPSDWIVKRGKFLFREISERSKKGEEQLLSVSEHRGIVPRDSINVTMFQAMSYEGYKLCNKGDIVINSLWAWHRGLGVSEYHGIVSTAYGVYRPLEPEKWNHRFLNYLLRDRTYVGECLIRSKGIWESRYQLTGSNFLDIPILQPPLEVQNRIVAYLDKKNEEIDKFIRNKERIIELLEELKSKTILKYVTKGINTSVELHNSEVDWLGEIPHHWKIQKIKHVCNVEYGISTQLDGRFKSGTPIISLPNVSIFGELNVAETDYYQLSKNERSRFLLKKEDLLFNWRNGSPEHVGKTAFFNLEGEYTHVSFLLRLRFNPLKAHYGYFRHFINGLRLAGFFNSARQKINMTFNKTELNNFTVTVPPISEQIQITQTIDRELLSIDKQIHIIKREIISSSEFREALITDLVTGKRSVPTNFMS